MPFFFFFLQLCSFWISPLGNSGHYPFGKPAAKESHYTTYGKTETKQNQVWSFDFDILHLCDKSIFNSQSHAVEVASELLRSISCLKWPRSQKSEPPCPEQAWWTPWRQSDLRPIKVVLPIQNLSEKKKNTGKGCCNYFVCRILSWRNLSERGHKAMMQDDLKT